MKFVSGLANCHLPGLYSLVLSERESATVGMRRVFYAGVDCHMDLWDGADFRIKPHNHRQDIKLTLLFGKVENVSMKIQPIGFEEFHVWKYEFGSALLNGQFDLKRREEVGVILKAAPITKEGIHLHWSDVHTVTAKPHSAWLIEEGDRAPEGMERCYSISHHLEMSSEGLYQSMTADALLSMERVIQERMAA
jgi:hypothetical protein